jgi:hypothetical protein
VTDLVDNMCPQYDVMRLALYQNKLRKIYKWLARILGNYKGHKLGNSEKLSHSRVDYGDLTTKHNEVWWIGAWYRKGILGENKGNLNEKWA